MGSTWLECESNTGAYGSLRRYSGTFGVCAVSTRNGAKLRIEVDWSSSDRHPADCPYSGTIQLGCQPMSTLRESSKGNESSDDDVDIEVS